MPRLLEEESSTTLRLDCSEFVVEVRQRGDVKSSVTLKSSANCGAIVDVVVVVAEKYGIGWPFEFACIGTIESSVSVWLYETSMVGTNKRGVLGVATGDVDILRL